MKQTTNSGPEPEKIQNLFGTIAKSYDKANDVMTFGLVRRWRSFLISKSRLTENHSVLDCATGTGDLALNFKLAGAKSVLGLDFCREMLNLAEKKARAKSIDVDFEWGDILNLSYSDNSFDICSIAYGLRNVHNLTKAISEMARVTKPQGKVLILETGQDNSMFQPLVNMHFKYFVPIIGGFISGNRSAYEHLNESSRIFKGGRRFVNLIESTNLFSEIEYYPLLLGASHLYVGHVRP